MPQDRSQEALPIIDRIYAAALEPGVWQDAVAALSDAFDGAAVLLAVNLPGLEPERQRFGLGLVDAFRDSYVEHLIGGLPWRPDLERNFVGRFAGLGDSFPGVELRDTRLYRAWMRPQKLAPVWPIGIAIAFEPGVPVGGLSLFRPLGRPPFRADDLAFGDLLAPHLIRAFHVQATLGGARRQRIALAEVVDRLPTGVILLDRNRQPVVTNRAADQILALSDGIHIDHHGPYLSTPRENDALKQLLASALSPERGREIEAGGFIAVTRPSGRRAYVLMVTPLVAAPPGSQEREAAVSIFIADPEAGRVSARELLERIYALTPAQAELVQLLSQGNSLEQAAAARGVTMNTARSQLKQVFAKTDTRRQGELVRLVLTGVASLRKS